MKSGQQAALVVRLALRLDFQVVLANSLVEFRASLVPPRLRALLPEADAVRALGEPQVLPNLYVFAGGPPQAVEEAVVAVRRLRRLVVVPVVVVLVRLVVGHEQAVHRPARIDHNTK